MPPAGTSTGPSGLPRAFDLCSISEEVFFMSESTDLSALKARLEDVEARQAILDAEKKCHSRGDPEGMRIAVRKVPFYCTRASSSVRG